MYGRLGTTLLEARSISPKVETEYRRLYALFEKWSRRRGLPMQSLAERDGALAQYGTHLCLLGHPAADSSKNRAAAAFDWQDVGKSSVDLRRAHRAQRGFVKMAPSRSRLPAPWLLVAHIVSELAREEKTDEAMGVLLMFMGYLRPCDLLGVRGAQLTALMAEGGAAHSRWSLILHPLERKKPSKVGVYGECVLLTNPEFEELMEAMRLWKLRAGPQRKLVPAQHNQPARDVREGCARLGYLSVGIEHLYQLRHSGASFDVASGHLDVVGAMKKGRWRSMSSLRRYERGGRLNEVLARLSPQQLRAARVARSSPAVTLEQSFCRPIVKRREELASSSASPGGNSPKLGVKAEGCRAHR